MRDRFGVVHRLDYYNEKELETILTRSAFILEIAIVPQGANEIARRSRGTPRIANRLLRRVRDYAQVKADGVITRDVASKALEMMEVDAKGLDNMDHKLLLAMIEKYAGGPVGIESLAASISEEKDTIEDVLEPYLIQTGFIQRTPRGRIATPMAYEHFNKVPPNQGKQEKLF